MIISHQYKFIYFRGFKNASATLTLRLSELNTFSPILFKRMDYKKYLDVFIEQLIEPRFHETLFQYYKFGACSNPYDHTYSGYLEEQHRLLTPELNNKSFEQVVTNKKFPGHLSAQHPYIGEDGCNLLDFTLYLERFEKDFDEICKILNLPNIKKLNKNVRYLNSNMSDPHNMKFPDDYKYIDKYNSEMISIINEYFAQDFKCFGYQTLEPKHFPKTIDKSLFSCEN